MIVSLSLLFMATRALAEPSCYIGSYRSPSGPWNACAGYRDCEAGSYCIAGEKYSCPGGTYGSSSGLSTKSCSGTCPAGHYCPLGAVGPIPCGNSSMYCPLGSAVPLPIPSGHYGTGSSNSKLFSEVQKCPKGSYCVEGRRHACHSGYYGNSEGLFTETCSGPCPAGWFCPAGSTSAKDRPCELSPAIFCPERSSHQRSVNLGFYATDSRHDEGGGYGAEAICPSGSYCQGGVRHLCPGGRFGSFQQMTNASCSGVCKAGWYCPEGSISSTQNPCGYNDNYCPEGSAAPVQVRLGHYTIGEEEEHGEHPGDNHDALNKLAMEECGPGYYCAADGVRRLCPPGSYGSAYGLHSKACSGPCDAGYYCPAGSTSPTQVQCGSPAVFCPAGSGEPLPVAHGYYSAGPGLAVMRAERECEPGHWCVGGVRKLCDFGYWGDLFGMNVSTCVGQCAPGHYCPEGSISPTEVQCGDANKYCPGEGNFKPTLVDKGYYSVGGNQSTREDQMRTPPGSFSENGILYACPAGRYGSESGMSSSACSGLCSRGYYCPAGSISPFMRACGSDDVVCPTGSIAPIRVASGFYTTDFWSEGCKPGTWRNWTGLSKDVTRKLPFPIPTKNSIPDCEVCPEGTYKAHRGDDLELCLPCPLDDSVSSIDGLTCECYRQLGGAPVPRGEALYFNTTTGTCLSLNPRVIMKYSALPSDFNTSITRFEELSCLPGSYCVEGVMRRCPPGRYGSLTRETKPTCEGVCPKGYYCPEGTVGPYSNPCGRVDLYCPQGSPAPVYVRSGYYSINDGYDSEFDVADISNVIYPSSLLPHAHARSAEAVCPFGHYCVDAEIHPCPKGRYGDSLGITDPKCSGPCAPGYYCPTVGSFNPKHSMCGNASVYCPRGSFESQPVHEGFYCAFSGDSQGADELFSSGDAPTCSLEVPCEPGYYCSQGNRIPCPPGRFGWRFGMTNDQCTGDCAAGYYCPSTLLPQLGTPEWTVWPGVPQTSAFEYECGGVGWYCPVGSSYPLKVGGGNFTFGGSSALNTTRRGQAPCEKGNFCTDGLIQPCPRGRYGNSDALTDSVCTQICPAGFYCPEGSATPIPCPRGYYSGGGVWECLICPGIDGLDVDAIELPCQDSRSCCFRF